MVRTGMMLGVLALVACGGAREVEVTIEATDTVTVAEMAAVRTLEITVLGTEPSAIRYPIKQEFADRKTTWLYKSKADGPLVFQVTARGDKRKLIAAGKSEVVTPGSRAVSVNVKLGHDQLPVNKRRMGQACDAEVDVCGTGFCVDGVCCDSACTGDCNTCNGATPGHCAPAVVGTNPRKKCATDPATPCGMDGSCDGAGACRIAPQGKVCAQAKCNAGMFTNASTCDGAGVCSPPMTRSCVPYACNSTNTACATICTLAAGCAMGVTCNFGNCGKVEVGARCFGGADCNTGTCIDGYCCDSACDGACKSCKEIGHEGQCVSVAPGGDDVHKICADTGSPTCGKNGKCDAAGGCAFYPKGTLCGTASCSADATMVTGPSVCAGDGSPCPAQVTTACAPYRCATDGSPGCEVSCGECSYYGADMGPPISGSCAAGSSCVDHCLMADSQFVCQ